MKAISSRLKVGFHRTEKMFSLCLNMGKRLDQPLFLSSLHAQALAAQVAKGRGNWDISALICFYSDVSAPA